VTVFGSCSRILTKEVFFLQAAMGTVLISRVAMYLSCATLLCFLLSACGGGIGGTQSPNSPTPPPQGFFRVTSSFFGLHVNRTTTWPSVAFSSLRIWDDGAKWYLLCPTPTCDFTALDIWIEKAHANGLTDIAYTFGRTPVWASSNPTDISCNGSPGACYAPSDLNADGTGSNLIWRDYVTAIATHAGKNIQYWEIWNEPNGQGFWKGTTAQLVRMAKDAREIILGINPSAKILSPAPYGLSTAPNWLDGFFAAGGAQYIDIVSFHTYYFGAQKCGSYPVAETVASQIDAVRNVAAKYGLQDKPIWSSEGSWGDGSAACFNDHDLRSAFIGRYFVIIASKGLERFYWYGWDYGPEHGAFWDVTAGLLPEAGAYSQMHDWIANAALGPCTATGTVWSCPVAYGTGSTALLMWDTSQTCSNGVCTTIMMNGPSDVSFFDDLEGNTFPAPNHRVPVGLKPIRVR